MIIRESTDSDKMGIVNVHVEAFGTEEGPKVASLVNHLLIDKSAKPLLSLVAVANESIIGHILFTKASIPKATKSVSVQILAPLAVHPDSQGKGIGEQLIKNGLSELKKMGVELVFVLGHPGYYPRSGFVQAGELGFKTPFPIPEENAGAWMVQELCTGIIGKVKGKIKCSDVLNQPEHWRE